MPHPNKKRNKPDNDSDPDIDIVSNSESHSNSNAQSKRDAPLSSYPTFQRQSGKGRNILEKEKAAVSGAISDGTVIAFGDTRMKNEFLQKYFKYPLTKGYQLYSKGEYVACRAIVEKTTNKDNINKKDGNKSNDNNKNDDNNNNNAKAESTYCNHVLTNASLGNKHLKQHLETCHGIVEKISNSSGKNKITNYVSKKKDIDPKHKSEIAKIEAKGFAKNMRPFLMAEDDWIAEIFQYAMTMGRMYGVRDVSEIKEDV